MSLCAPRVLRDLRCENPIKFDKLVELECARSRRMFQQQQTTASATMAVPYESTDRELPCAPSLFECVTISREEIMPEEMQDREHPAWLLHGIMSPSECDFYIDAATKMGMEDSGYPHHYRNCDRVTAMSSTASEALFERVKPFVSGRWVGTQRWEPVGMNPCWRICSYEPGGHFSPHFDGGYRESATKKSFLTFMIYLNHDGIVGGATNFLDSMRAFKNDGRGKKLVRAVPPRQGTACVFEHSKYYHEGAKLEGGKKWIMRSEIMFQLTDETRVPPPRTIASNPDDRPLPRQADAGAGAGGDDGSH